MIKLEPTAIVKSNLTTLKETPIFLIKWFKDSHGKDKIVDAINNGEQNFLYQTLRMATKVSEIGMPEHKTIEFLNLLKVAGLTPNHYGMRDISASSERIKHVSKLITPETSDWIKECFEVLGLGYGHLSEFLDFLDSTQHENIVRMVHIVKAKGISMDMGNFTPDVQIWLEELDINKFIRVLDFILYFHSELKLDLHKVTIQQYHTYNAIAQTQVIELVRILKELGYHYNVDDLMTLHLVSDTDLDDLRKNFETLKKLLQVMRPEYAFVLKDIVSLLSLAKNPHSLGILQKLDDVGVTFENANLAYFTLFLGIDNSTELIDIAVEIKRKFPSFTFSVNTIAELEKLNEIEKPLELIDLLKDNFDFFEIRIVHLHTLANIKKKRLEIVVAYIQQYHIKTLRNVGRDIINSDRHNEFPIFLSAMVQLLKSPLFMKYQDKIVPRLVRFSHNSSMFFKLATLGHIGHDLLTKELFFSTLIKIMDCPALVRDYLAALIDDASALEEKSKKLLKLAGCDAAKQFVTPSATPKKLLEKIDIDSLLDIQNGIFVPLAMRLLTADEGLFSHSPDFVKKILGDKLFEQIQAIKQAKPDANDISVVSKYFQGIQGSSTYVQGGQHLHDSKDGFCFFMHGTSEEFEKSIINGNTGIEKRHDEMPPGAFASMHHDKSKYYGKSLVLIYGKDLRDSYVNLEEDSTSRIRDARFVDANHKMIRVPSRLLYRIKTCTSEQPEEAEQEQMYEFARFLKVKQLLESHRREIYQHFKDFIVGLEKLPHYVGKLYQDLRAGEYNEPKILEVVDSYIQIRVLLVFESKPELQRMKEMVEKAVDKGVDPGTIHDYLTKFGDDLEALELDFSKDVVSQMNRHIAKQTRELTKKYDFRAKGFPLELEKDIRKIMVGEQVPSHGWKKLSAIWTARKVERKYRAHMMQVMSFMVKQRCQDLKEAVGKAVTALGLPEGLQLGHDFDFALTSSSARGECVPHSDLDFFMVVMDSKIKTTQSGYLSEVLQKVTANLGELGRYGHIDVAEFQKNRVLAPDDLDKGLDAGTFGREAEPTAIIDMIILHADDKLEKTWQDAIKEVYSRPEVHESVVKIMQDDLAKYYSSDVLGSDQKQGFKEVFDLELNGDVALGSFKKSILRTFQFAVYFLIFKHIKKIYAAGYHIPPDFAKRLSLLRRIHVISHSEEGQLRRAYYGFVKQRFKGSILGSPAVTEGYGKEQLDPRHMTTLEREHIRDYMQILLKFLKDTIPELFKKRTDIIYT